MTTKLNLTLQISLHKIEEKKSTTDMCLLSFLLIIKSIDGAKYIRKAKRSFAVFRKLRKKIFKKFFGRFDVLNSSETIYFSCIKNKHVSTLRKNFFFPKWFIYVNQLLHMYVHYNCIVKMLVSLNRHIFTVWTSTTTTATTDFLVKSFLKRESIFFP